MKKKKASVDTSRESESIRETRSIPVIISILVCILMIAGSIAMILGYLDTIEEEAGNTAQKNIDYAASYLQDGIYVYKALSQNFGSAILGGSYEDENDFSVQVHRLSREDRFGNIVWHRVYKKDAEYNANDDEFDITMELPEITDAIEKNELRCIGVVPDRQFNLSTMAYCVPLPDFEYADAVLVFYWVREIASYSPSLVEENYDNSQITVFCAPTGEIVRIIHADEKFGLKEYGDLYDIIRSEVNDKLFVDKIRTTIEGGGAQRYHEYVAGHSSIFVVSNVVNDDSTVLSAVGYYQSADIYPAGYMMLRAILGLLIIFFIVLVVLSIYILVMRLIHRRRNAALTEISPTLGCASRIKFEKVTAEIIDKNKATAFAVAVIDINHYQYIREQLGQEITIKLLKHIEMLISKALQLDETYGYNENGRFLLLIHFRELKTVEQRIINLNMLVNQHCSQITNSANVTLYGGIYTTDRGLTNITGRMVDYAIDAEHATNIPNDFGQFRFYNEALHSSIEQHNYIEVHMESALQNHDFKVFYQPKYNIQEKQPDGCEALIRWYNSEIDEYMKPDVFLPLFEANGFIVKLDHYVFEQVCLYIEDAVMNGLSLVPVSVNVSRMTAIAGDFIQFYSQTKKKHNIADHFITLEFTESFAYEDYEVLRDTVGLLHQCGFKCSIDDFGSGFSSYNILKELPMDEIKLDRFFIKKGFSHDRDLKVLSSVISLARELKMKVTQEGVETQGELELLKSLGCQVIQGYFYSKPLALVDYTGFLENDKII